MRSLLIMMLLVGLLTSTSYALAQEPLTWQGQVDGVPTWITVVPRGHSIPADTVRGEPWWQWGNTSTDVYLFAFGAPDNVRLILEFITMVNGLPEARLYMLERGGAPVDFSLDGTELTVHSDGGHPRLIVRPDEEGWFAGGSPNYNLTILEDGFDGDGDERVDPDGTPDLLLRVGSEEPGIPAWETQRLVHDPWRGRGYPRFDARQRMEGAPPFRVAASVMPSFPYLGIGQRRPSWFDENPNPLYFNANIGEFLLYPFTGFQNGGIYAVHSINLPPRLNFEAPFVFYNFDPNTRQAHMAMRGFVFPSNDHFGPEYKGVDYANIRYSWKTWDEERWAYNLHLAGFNTYLDTIQIGDEEFVGVSGEDFPSWASDAEWAQITFVEAVNGMPGSEGIYYYNPVLWDWLTGQTDYSGNWLWDPVLPTSTELSIFSSIGVPPGFRGEYYVGTPHSPSLYASSIDNRIHLLGAQGGIWHLDGGHFLRTHNLSGGPYLDGWTRERIQNFDALSQDFDDSGQEARTRFGEVEESLFLVGPYMVYSGTDHAEIRSASFEIADLPLTPPTDKASWRAFREETAAYQGQDRDPENLQQWLESFPGPALTVQGATVSDARFIEGEYRFILTLSDDAVMGGELEIPSLGTLGEGKHVLTYNPETDTWSTKVALPPRLDATWESGALQLFTPSQISVAMHNTGGMELAGQAELTVADNEVMRWENIVIPGGEEVEEYFNWTPGTTGIQEVKLMVAGEIVSLGTIAVSPASRISGLDSFRLSLGRHFGVLSGLLLLAFFIAVRSLWLVWWAK